MSQQMRYKHACMCVRLCENLHLNGAILKSMFLANFRETSMVNCQTMVFIKKPKLRFDILSFILIWHIHTQALTYIETIFLEMANNYSIRADQVAKMQKANNLHKNHARNETHTKRRAVMPCALAQLCEKSSTIPFSTYDRNEFEHHYCILEVFIRVYFIKMLGLKH